MSLPYKPAGARGPSFAPGRRPSGGVGADHVERRCHLKISRARPGAARPTVSGTLGPTLVFGALIAAWTAGGQAPGADARPLPTSSPGARGAGLERLAFMSGCWAQTGDGLREQFTAPTANMILGMSRYVVNGEVVQFEFHRITAGASGPILTPHPNGVASDSFAASVIEEGHVVFENPEHDFPQRISYDGRRPDTLVAAIEGDRDGRTVRREWPMIRTACGARAP